MEVNALKYTSPSGVVSYINPLNRQTITTINPSGYSQSAPNGGSGSGGSGGSGSGGSGYASASNNWQFQVGPYIYTLPPIFRAKGALEDQGPRHVIVGESGPEIILPAPLTRMFTSLADMGFGQVSGGSAKDKIVIEDRTEHRWYMDGKEVTDVIMNRVMKQLQLRGAAPTR